MSKQWILLMRLEGPLQSWGERSRWDERDTAYFPTKSGVIGLLACAMGICRGDARIGALSDALHVSVRTDVPGCIITDFQTVSGIIRIANGGQRGNKGEVTTITSGRQYLEDAAFLVAVTGERSLLESCRDALLDPVWTPFLGRKCCVPTRPILDCLTDDYETVLDAFSRHPLARKRNEEPTALRHCQYEQTEGNLVRTDHVRATQCFDFRSVEQTTVEVQYDPI